MTRLRKIMLEELQRRNYSGRRLGRFPDLRAPLEENKNKLKLKKAP